MLASKKGDRARYGAGRSPSVASQIFWSERSAHFSAGIYNYCFELRPCAIPCVSFLSKVQ
uniref:Uncharacterized protein n=1 Tax=Siphoviridae sp. ct96x5 TaxID=2825367 RepID=A0A8S5PRR0_9CAUD|nr:MAG TPA: hypothetical protein [Siphoviridae sp. ct96x5]